MATVEEIQLHVDDVCTSKSSNETAVGYIERTHAEVESHAAFPANTYGGVHRHRSVPRKLYKTFLQDGIPPKGYALMQWQTESKVELVPCSDLVLLDRTFMSGDLVRSVQDPEKSGTVISTRSFCTLLSTCDVKEPKTGKIMKAAWLPSAPDEENLFQLVSDGKMLVNIPSSELKAVQTFNEADIIIYKNWVGRIKDCFDEVTVRLPDNGVVTIVDDRSLEAINGDPEERFTVGSLVKTKKGVLRTGRWVYGSYSPNTPPVGVVVDVRTKECQVDWLHHSMSGDMSVWGKTPEAFLGLDELESDELFVYDTSKIPQDDQRNNSPTKSRSDPEFQGGIRVRFKDIVGASVKYNGNDSPNKIERLDRRDNLGYDMNVFTITSTVTEIDVEWSDKTMETTLATKVVRNPLADDEDAVFMGEIVCTNETKSTPSGDAADWTITPAKVGVAEQVNHKDRIAHVRWFNQGNLSFLDKDLTIAVANTYFMDLGTEVEEMSFYDIRAPKSINRDRGDFVILKSRPSPIPHGTTDGITWFGEVVDVGHDGTCTVRFGAANTVQELNCNITDTIPAMNQELEAGPIDSNEGEPELMDYIAEGSDDYSDDSDFDMDEFEEWYEDGQDIPIDEEDESWSTESEGGDADVLPDGTQEDSPATLAAVENTNSAISHSPSHSTKDSHELQEGETSGSAKSNQTGSNGTGEHTTSIPTEDLQLTILPNSPASYEILESEVPAGHHFWLQTGSESASHMKGIQREHKILSAPGALPEGVYVRTWESRMDLIRVLFVGPTGTPYEYAPFVIDLHLPPQYPYEPPKAFFHSWTAEGAGMSGRVNPNLYEEGKICLSLLGTWQGDESKNEAWAPNKSTVLQVLVSILGLVLVKEPWYNEAGYESLQGLSSINQNVSAYTERTYLRSRAFILSPVSRLTRGETAGLEGLEGLIRWLYMEKEGAGLMSRAIKACRTILANSEGDGSNVTPRDGLTVVTRGAALPLKRVTGRLEQLLES